MNDEASSQPPSRPVQGVRPAPGPPLADAMGVFTVEVGAWLTILTAAALGFGVAGAFGVSAFVDPSQLSGIHALTGDGGFASRPAVLLYAAVLAAAVAGVFVPRELLSGRLALRVALGASIVSVALAVTLLFTVSAILAVIVGLGVGATFAAVLSLLSRTRAKPWRSAGAAAALILFATYAAQLLGGVGGGHAALRWLVLAGSLIMLAGVIVLFVKKADTGVELPETGSHSFDRGGIARPGTPVQSAWPNHLLFAVLGAVGILAQPTVADLGFGQAGMSVILCAVLLGWAVGYETGPDFAPGMTRTRLTSFSLIAAGALTVATGVLTELSGAAVLSGGVAFLVGLGVRSQHYTFSRRVGAVAGMGIAVLITAAGVSAEIPLSPYAAWDLHPAGLSYIVIGAVALIAGVVSLFTFGPTGVHGIGVDVVHAFRVPLSARAAAHTHESSHGSGPFDPAVMSSDEPQGSPNSSERAAQQSAAGPHTAGDETSGHEAAGDEVAGSDAASNDAAGRTLSSALSRSAGSAESPHRAGQSGAVQTDGGLSASSLSDGGPSDAGGLFVAIEGGDGTGKSTQIHLLADALRDQGRTEVVTTREPGGTEAGRLLRSVVLDGDGVTPRAEALVFAADRAHHVASLIRPIVGRGGIVITDRYIDSSRAYQAAGRDLGDEEIVALSEWATEGLRPDLTIVLDANPAVTRQRTTSRGDENHLDALDNHFHTTVRKSFLAFAAANPDRYVVIDAGRDIDTIAADVLRAVEERLAAPRNRTPHTGGVVNDVDAGDAPTVVHRRPAPVGNDDETRVVKRVTPDPQPIADDAQADPEPPPHDRSSDVNPPPPPVVDMSEAPTTVQRAVSSTHRPSAARQTSRERLRAQAEIERQARERLRAQRGNDRRGPHGPGGPVQR